MARGKAASKKPTKQEVEREQLLQRLQESRRHRRGRERDADSPEGTSGENEEVPDSQPPSDGAGEQDEEDPAEGSEPDIEMSQIEDILAQAPSSPGRDEDGDNPPPEQSRAPAASAALSSLTRSKQRVRNLDRDDDLDVDDDGTARGKAVTSRDSNSRARVLYTQTSGKSKRPVATRPDSEEDADDQQFSDEEEGSSRSQQQSSGARRRRDWTDEETECLKNALDRITCVYGTKLPYVTVLAYHGENGIRDNKLRYRDNGQLKDKARNICLAARRDGEAIPFWKHLILSKIWNDKEQPTPLVYESMDSYRAVYEKPGVAARYNAAANKYLGRKISQGMKDSAADRTDIVSQQFKMRHHLDLDEPIPKHLLETFEDETGEMPRQQAKKSAAKKGTRKAASSSQVKSSGNSKASSSSRAGKKRPRANSDEEDNEDEEQENDEEEDDPEQTAVEKRPRPRPSSGKVSFSITSAGNKSAGRASGKNPSPAKTGMTTRSSRSPNKKASQSPAKRASTRRR